MLALETPSERLRTSFIEVAMEFEAHGNSRYVQDATNFTEFLRPDAEALE